MPKLGLTFLLAMGLSIATAAGAQIPFGERHLGKTVIEPQIFVVLFNNAEAANTHITTEAQLGAAIETGDAFTVETPIVFHCNLVSASVYNRGTPVTPVGP